MSESIIRLFRIYLPVFESPKNESVSFVLMMVGYATLLLQNQNYATKLTPSYDTFEPF